MDQFLPVGRLLVPVICSEEKRVPEGPRVPDRNIIFQASACFQSRLFLTKEAKLGLKKKTDYKVEFP